MEEIKEIKIEDPDYPKSLKEIKNPPKVLYYKGTLPTENETLFAIVGARINSPYGKQVALSITQDLAEAGLTIVSGLAPGIDTFCHTATVELKKKTIAVLGTGIDEKSLFPKSNLALSRKIVAEGGCLLSEYAPGTSGTRFTFPQRNRIIAGLSIGTLVVEAKEKSGALITAEFAKKQGKKVFAIPGPIYSSTSKGCNQLLKQGAILVENTNDILKALNIVEVKKSEITGENKQEILILQALKEEALYIDKIIKATKLPTATVSGALAILEIKGKVRNLGANIWSLCN